MGMTAPSTALVPNRLALSMAEPMRVLVVDDLAVVRAGLAMLLAGDAARPRAVFTAANGAEALRLAASVRPHVVLLDSDLAGEDGLALLPWFAPVAIVVVLTSEDDDATRRRAMRGGAHGLVLKTAPGAALLALLGRLVA